MSQQKRLPNLLSIFFLSKHGPNFHK